MTTTTIMTADEMAKHIHDKAIKARDELNQLKTSLREKYENALQLNSRLCVLKNDLDKLRLLQSSIYQTHGLRHVSNYTWRRMSRAEKDRHNNLKATCEAESNAINDKIKATEDEFNELYAQVHRTNDDVDIYKDILTLEQHLHTIYTRNSLVLQFTDVDMNTPVDELTALLGTRIVSWLYDLGYTISVVLTANPNPTSNPNPSTTTVNTTVELCPCCHHQEDAKFSTSTSTSTSKDDYGDGVDDDRYGSVIITVSR